MGSPAAQLLLESVLAPLTVAGLVLVSTQMLGRGRHIGLAQAFAILLAIGTTYVLAFGLPAGPIFNARMKIIASVLVGLAAGLAIERRARWARLGLIAGAIGLPVWIGLPALFQGRLESTLLIFPIMTALAAPSLIGRMAPSPRTAGISIMLTLAIGLAAIAVLAKVFSFAELCLSLGSALLAILLVGQKPLALPAVITAAAALLALTSALLLYSEASPLSLVVLCFVIGAERLARLSGGSPRADATMQRVLVFCALPAALAILIARIDAGPISIY